MLYEAAEFLQAGPGLIAFFALGLAVMLPCAALYASGAALVVGAHVLESLGPGFLHDVVWSFVLTEAFLVLCLVPVRIEGRKGRPDTRTAGYVILEALGLLGRGRPVEPAPRAPVEAGPRPTMPHAPLRNRDGQALGVEPLQRGEAEEPHEH